MPITSNGTTFAIGGAVPTADPQDVGETYTDVADVISVGGRQLSATTIDTTALSDVNTTSIRGRLTHGPIPITLQYTPSDVNHQTLIALMLSGAERNYRVTWPGGANWHFRGQCISQNFTNEAEDKVMVEIEMKADFTINYTDQLNHS